MTTVKAMLAIGSVIISSAAGCEEPGIIEINRIIGGDGSTAEDAGGAAEDAGDSAEDAGDSAEDAGGPPAPGPCPAGYTCTDLSTIGTVTDGNGKPVTYACGNGMLTACDDANPSTTCAPFTAPICAHIQVAGMQLVSCAQRCTP